ncbi:hypothetical protein DPMN_150521 [Dreissena polymorpha]|uniref:Uncharacterized protein n=1 Tax=Dreissena polymorpha TaxID=45954 RepID=A0A9D4FDW9_DREPO|nr:hypothetical protein DPMN_150521 [Dreissena polymorpha]
MPDATSIAPALAAQWCILVRSYALRYKVTEGFMISLADKMAPDGIPRLRRLVWSYAGWSGATQAGLELRLPHIAQY